MNRIAMMAAKKSMNNLITRKQFVGTVLAAGLCGRGMAASRASNGKRWYRGMLHMHTHWSDGRALPEQAVAAYKNAGYDFISVSDHNRFQDDPDKWMAVGNGTEKGWPPKVVHPDCFKAYVERFGRGKVRERDGKTEVRLATYSELKQMFEVPGKFLMLPGVEITTDTKATGVTYAMHMNVIGIDDIIERAKKAPLIEKLPKHTVAFKIRFISTKKGAPLDPVRYVEIPPTKEHFNRARKVPVYDARIGATVKLVEGKKGNRLEASYTLASDDLYVRARVESDAPTKFKRKRCLHPAHHTAWTQPYSGSWFVVRGSWLVASG